MKLSFFPPGVLLVILSFSSCFGPFNPNDPTMGLLPKEVDTLTTAATLIAWWRCNDSGETVMKNSATTDPLNRGVMNYISFDSGVDNSGKSLKFDGNVSHVQVNDDSTLDFKTGDFTISLWCKSQIIQSTDTGTIIAKGLKDSDSTFSLSISNKRIIMILGSTRFSPTGNTDTLADDKWHHIVLRRSEHILSLYVDKTKYAPGSTVKNLINNQPLYLGADGSKDNYFTGSLDEIQIERKAWSDTKVATEYSKYK